jgi:hypothetical protein
MDCLNVLEGARGDVNKWVVGSDPTPAIVQLLILMEASFPLSDHFHCHPNS